MKLVETKWTTSEEGIEGKPQKKYRSYYSSFNINISCPVNELSEIFTVASLTKKEFEQLEDEIYDYIGKDGKFGNMVAENFGLSTLSLKSLVKRSNKFCYKGLKLARKE
jgi:predicted DNA-binding ArsR family transcriptional regulator